MTDLTVLVVDDDFRVAELHSGIVNALIGFQVVATAGSIAAARSAVAESAAVDLALVDVHLPDGSGIDLLPKLSCDAFILGAENDAAAVRQAFRSGALAYLIKPFDATELARRLSGYAHYRRVLDAPEVDQQQLDTALSALRFGSSTAERTETRSATAEVILALFATPDTRLFADDVSAALGIAAPTARRHLATLVAAGQLNVELQYGSTGRPRQEYRLRVANPGR